MSKRPVQLRIDEKLLEQLQDENNLSQLFRQLANMYLGLPSGTDRDFEDVAGVIIDGLDAQAYQLEKKVWSSSQFSEEHKAELESLSSQALGIVHPKCQAARNLDLVKGQLLIGRLALLRLELELRADTSAGLKIRG